MPTDAHNDESRDSPRLSAPRIDADHDEVELLDAIEEQLDEVESTLSRLDDAR